MLVLTRRVGQTVKIGEEIEITVVAINGDQVRLGIEAPRHVSVHRKEVLEQIARENVLAAQSAAQATEVSELLQPEPPEKK